MSRQGNRKLISLELIVCLILVWYCIVLYCIHVKNSWNFLKLISGYSPADHFDYSLDGLNMNLAKQRGRLIVFEGADRSGKTTQTLRCVKALREAGHKVAADCPWRFPDRSTEVGKLIDSYLKANLELDDRVLHLLFSSNRWEKVKQIRDSIDCGETVIIDRYAFSGVAYSSAKGLDFEWCKQPDTGLPAPDCVIYLDLPFSHASKRGEFGAERYECESLQRAVAKQFTLLHDDTWCIVDANGTEDEVFGRVMQQVDRLMGKGTNSEVIPSLWLS